MNSTLNCFTAYCLAKKTGYNGNYLSRINVVLDATVWKIINICLYHVRVSMFYNKKIENMLQELGYNMKMSYKLLILGYKCTYDAYKDINVLMAFFYYFIQSTKTG